MSVQDHKRWCTCTRNCCCGQHVPSEGSGLALAAAARLEKSGGVGPASADTVITLDAPASAACPSKPKQGTKQGTF